jgi:NAD(P)-dependent dehydrogenase (short-subunit alcohol dehydrogenase family)
VSAFLSELFGLDGRIALVTGASSGLGRHFALTLARAGAHVAVTARRLDRLQVLAREIEALGVRALAVAMDIADRASVRAGLEHIAATLGTPQILINNAGVGDVKGVLEFTDADWDRIVGTNLKGSWIVAQECAQRMVDGQIPGSIVNVTSILATRVAGGISPYATAKAGLKQLTRAMALELARYGIRVNSLAPGYFLTEANEALFASTLGDKLREHIPTRKFGTGADLDGALLLLASAAGRHMTGSEIVVDAGHLCSTL